METIENFQTVILAEDITLICVAAKSFPDGVMESHQKLHSIFPYSTERKYYGISRPEDGKILYKAATSLLFPEDNGKEGTETVILKKGKYLSTIVHDFMKDINGIGNAFTQLMEQPSLDPEGYCVESYLDDKDVQCMIRLAN
jgi:hypothetical protein